jgi:cytochrome c oxidase assembly protein subunit 11
VQANTPEKSKSTAPILWPIVLVVMVMFGFGFALVPLYNVFCELTGLNGKVKTEASAEAAYPVTETRELSLEFVTTLNQGMPLAFNAETSKLKVTPGKYYTVKFFGENLTDKPMVGRAVPSIAPGWATQYLKKTECFCFSEQTFEPHKRREMPVRFVIDPAIPEKARDLTLSYTFFDITDKNSP